MNLIVYVPQPTSSPNDVYMQIFLQLYLLLGEVIKYTTRTRSDMIRKTDGNVTPRTNGNTSVKKPNGYLATINSSLYIYGKARW